MDSTKYFNYHRLALLDVQNKLKKTEIKSRKQFDNLRREQQEHWEFLLDYDRKNNLQLQEAQLELNQWKLLNRLYYSRREKRILLRRVMENEDNIWNIKKAGILGELGFNI